MKPKNRAVYDFGDVVRVPYRGSRPGVVISCARHNASAWDVVVMMITTKDQHSMRGAAIIIDNWKEIGLDEPSVIKPVIFSYEADEIKLVAKLDKDTKAAVRRSMAQIFGLGIKSHDPT